MLSDELKINNWKNQSYDKVSKLTARFTIDGKEIVLPLKAMQCAGNKAPNTLKLPHAKKANNPGVSDSMNALDKTWKTIVKTGKIVLPKEVLWKSGQRYIGKILAYELPLTTVRWTTIMLGDTVLYIVDSYSQIFDLQKHVYR